MSARGAIVVFAKVPRPGAVKTRMCPPLSLPEAAALHAHMLEDVLEATAASARRLGLDPVLALHPVGGVFEVLAHTPPDVRVIAQRGPDLSQRMQWAAAEVAASGVGAVLLRGSDSPALPESLIEEALGALESCDLALSPDVSDGGYNLVALRRPAAGLFDHAMSTDRVLEDTLAAAAGLGLETILLAPSFDIDTAADLSLLARARGGSDALPCPRTLAYLDEMELWRHLGAGPSRAFGRR